jgi:2-keto-4-pentenoate hydratase/2-oxohepta-3-ene-1,7-dioic acid hydratase in catechol pathway|tara:strand:- start:1335 stop:1946 length:612 start_codon:yes stop_codon:yes gene_type:complete
MKLICIGKNYLKHIHELNSKKEDDPVIFLKPDTSVIQKKQPFFIPEFSSDIHYEVEIILKFNRVGKHIEPKFSKKYFDKISLGIDFTARDLQRKFKENGLPWDIAKGFDNSAMIGDWLSVDLFDDIDNINFRLEKNGEIVQKSNSSNMIWKIDQLISKASTFFTIKIGDIMFTGTPEGVGKVVENDLLEGYIDDKKVFSVRVK